MNTAFCEQAEFLARITASTTHEIRNVLAIIKESAGLMHDVMNAREGAPVDRLERSIERIETQVGRGVDLISHLNGLAHSLGPGSTDVSMNAQVEEAAALSRRFARSEGHAIEACPGDPTLHATLNPLNLQMALVAGIEVCIESLPLPGLIRIRAVSTQQGPGVEFSVESDGKIQLGQSIRESSDFNTVMGFVNATVIEQNDPTCFQLVPCNAPIVGRASGELTYE